MKTVSPARAFPILIATLAAMALFAVVAAGAGTGTVSGTVMDGTVGRPVSGLDVTLFSFDSSGERRGVYTATTEADGRFLFPDVEVIPEAKYVAAAKYEGVVYYSDTGVFSGTKGIHLTLNVFEPTADPKDVAVHQAIWTVNFSKHRLVVGEMYVFANLGNAAYVGDGRRTLTFALPPGAEGVQFQNGEIGRRFVRLSDVGYADTLPLVPGKPVMISLRYELPYTGTGASLAHAIPYPVAQFGVFVEDIGEDAWMNIPAKEQRRSVQGVEHLVFTSSDVPAGKEIRLELRKLPGEPLKPMPWWAYAGMIVAGSALGVGAALVGRRVRAR